MKSLKEVALMVPGVVIGSLAFRYVKAEAGWLGVVLLIAALGFFLLWLDRLNRH